MIDNTWWIEDAQKAIRMTQGSYFDKPLSSHAEWALTLQPGQKVLTKWDDRVPEYASAVPWEHKDSDKWHEVTIRNTWKDKTCGSGVLVSFQELPDNWEYQFDSSWIKPIEKAPAATDCRG